MLTNWNASPKTKVPAWCSFDCCGNHFGRISRSTFRHDSRPNKIIKARRYAKHAEKNQIRKEILSELMDE